MVGRVDSSKPRLDGRDLKIPRTTRLVHDVTLLRVYAASAPAVYAPRHRPRPARAADVRA